MNKETINFKVENFKAKTKKVLKDGKEKAEKCIEWAMDNPEYAIGFLAAGTAAVSEIRKCNRGIQRKREHKKSRSEIWDPKRCRHYAVKRPCTHAEQNLFSIRMIDGESPAEVLRDMRLI